MWLVSTEIFWGPLSVQAEIQSLQVEHKNKIKVPQSTTSSQSTTQKNKNAIKTLEPKPMTKDVTYKFEMSSPLNLQTWYHVRRKKKSNEKFARLMGLQPKHIFKVDVEILNKPLSQIFTWHLLLPTLEIFVQSFDRSSIDSM